MRTPAALIIAAVLGATASAATPTQAAPPPALLIVPGRAVGPVALGMHAPQTIQGLGPVHHDGLNRFTWPRHRLTAIIGHHGRVAMILVESHRDRTQRGIGIGSTPEAVRAAYGPPPAHWRIGGTLTYKWPGITFVIRAGRVVTVAVHPPDIPPRAVATPQPVAATMPRQISALVVRWLDGDTLIVIWAARRIQVRLIGIDAPEIDRSARATRQARDLGRSTADIATLGRMAQTAAEDMAPRRSAIHLELDVRTHDRHGRLLAYIWRDDRMVNEEMLRQGFALAYTVPPNVRYADRFVAAQREARAAHRGLWGAP